MIIDGPPPAAESAKTIVEESKINDESTMLEKPTVVEVCIIKGTLEDSYEVECQQTQLEIWLQLPEGINTKDSEVEQATIMLQMLASILIQT